MTTPGRVPSAALPVAGVLTVAVVVLTSLPGTRTPTVLGITALATLAPLVGLRLHRPDRRGPWLAVSAMLACWLVSLAVRGTSLPAAIGLQTLGLTIAGGLFAILFARQRCRAPGDRRRTVRENWGRRADQLVVGTVVLLAVAQSAVAAMAPGAPWSVAFAPFDIVLVCLLLRFAASRADLSTSMLLLVAGGVCAAVYDSLTADSGTRILGPQHPFTVVWALGMCLFVAGALHPSMRDAFPDHGRRRLRSESARLVGLVPLVLIATALSLLDPAGRLPTWLYLSAGAVVAGLAIVRGAQTIARSEDQARHDPLTGLANRRGLRFAFDAQLPTTAPSVTPVGVLAVLDLDDFKHVNDTYGHETGDALLVAVGTRLAEAVGADGTVARSGGDEFVLLLRPGADDVSEVLATAFARPFRLDNGLMEQAFTVRSSAGWVELTGASDLWRSLADADVALYASKQGPKGTATRFEPAQREAVLGQLALAEDLRRLLRGETGVGDLELVFQPLVSLTDRRVLGCEALLRWRHPTLGLLSPDDFLPLAEVQGNGAALDTWVLHQACAVAAGWAGHGLPWTVSVNLGRSSMVDPELRCRVQTALARSGLSPHRLHLEITEHDQLPADAGVQALRALAATGVQVSLDDFGTGYTSLAYLQRYPVTVLKLDRSVTGIDSPTALLAGVVGMATALGITVLAEGIETEEQADRLAALGVDRGQGWLFGRPVPAEQLPVHEAEVLRAV